MLCKLSKKHIPLSVIALLSAAGFTYYQAIYLPAQTAEEPEVQTTVVRQGDLAIYASGSGTLIALDEIELGFGTGGPVSELHVQAGDVVQAGDGLAVQGDREQLEATVASDQLSVMNAQRAIDGLYENATVVAAQAQLELANTLDQLNTAEYTWSVQQEGNRASQAMIDGAEANLLLAEIELNKTQSAYNQVAHKPDDNRQKAIALSQLSVAQMKYDSALRELNWYKGEPSEIQQAQLDAEVAIAEALVAQAEREWEKVKDGPDPDELAMAELQLANAEAKLAVSERNLEESVLVSPIDGTVQSVTAQRGQDVTGAFITLANLNQL
ncbi:MAG: hypothetical protein GTO14_24370 [Anaerolineales bacterium]|nr:hypothetical protein [Anaerolineales bacterium]